MNSIGFSKLTEAGISSIFKYMIKNNIELEEIGLSRNQFGKEDLKSFCEFIKSCKTLKGIVLEQNHVNDKNIEEIAGYIARSDLAIRYLDLENNLGITGKSIPFLQKIVESLGIDKLNTAGTSIYNSSEFFVPLATNVLKNGCNKFIFPFRWVSVCI